MSILEANPTSVQVAGVHRAQRGGAKSSCPITAITRIVADVFEVEIWQLIGSSRKGPLAEARFAAWLILRDRGYLPSEIAPVFNRLDTGTVRHGCHRGRTLIQSDKRYVRRVKSALDRVVEMGAN